jgi:peptidoglycan lytic transglycosylase
VVDRRIYEVHGGPALTRESRVVTSIDPGPDCKTIDDHEVIMKSHLFMVALLQVALLEPARAADGKPDECGLAWVYSTASEETASGDDTRPEDFTAAHRSLPFGTLIHVNNQENGRTVVVRITDRGPFVSGRIVDFYGHLEK